MNRRRLLLSWIAAATWLVLLAPVVSAQNGANVLKDPFETEKPAWRQEKTDNQVKLFAHDRSQKSVREGSMAEHFQFEAGVGSGFYFSYQLPKIPVTPDLQVSLQVRSDRPGTQLLARVILPKDVDPETNQPSFVLVPGTILDTPERWTRLELMDLPSSIERQARVLRATTKRKVSLEEAYVDRLVINLYGGEGATEVFLDDLRIWPVTETLIAAHAKSLTAKPGDNLPPLPAEAAEANAEAKTGAPFELQRNRLTRNGFPWLFTGVRAPGALPAKLRQANFDLLALPIDADVAEIKEAADAGLVLMPEFDAGKEGERLDLNFIQQQIDAFPAKDKVAFISVGTNLGAPIDPAARARQLERARAAAKLIRKQTGIAPLSSGEVVGALSKFARRPDHLDILGVRPMGWGTMQSPTEMFDYLRQRNDLTVLENADAFIYSTITMSAPPLYKEAIWGKDKPPSWGIPRVQPDQMRLATFTAIAAGARGLIFEGSDEITLGSGRPLLIEAAFLNEEIDLFEWLLADTSKVATILPTYKPDPPAPPPTVGLNGMRNTVTKKKEEPPHGSIKAIMYKTKDRRGAVLFVADFDTFAQFQPPQMALKNLKIDIPGQAYDAEAYEISPGDVQVLDKQRIPGGTRITIPEFGPTSIIYITTDGSRIEEIQRAVVRVRPHAVNLAIEQAQLIYASVVETHQQLVDDGHKMAEADELLKLSVDSIKSAQDAQERQEYAVAWNEARRSGRPLAILMRYQWEQALSAIASVINDPKLPCGPVPLPGQSKPLPRITTPISAAPLVAFNTLPQAWIWKDWIRQGRLSKNLIPSGDFEDVDSFKELGWADESYRDTGIESAISTTNDGPGKNNRAIKLSGAPKDKSQIDELVPFQDLPVAAIRTPPIPVKEAEILRIAVMVNMPSRTSPGAGGVIVRDSLGGEALQFRQTSAIPGWQEIVIYRRAPASGEMTVMLGYAGLQFAQFDNLRVQKIISIDEKPQPPLAEGNRRTVR